jgi:anti-sigma regulatory factor (Ser/Thr protein kinase)
VISRESDVRALHKLWLAGLSYASPLKPSSSWSRQAHVNGPRAAAPQSASRVGGVSLRLAVMSSSSAELPEIAVVIAGGYPLSHVDRLVRELTPLLEIAEPSRIVIDLSGLVFLCPTAMALLTAASIRVQESGLMVEGVVHEPRSFLTRNYLMRMDFVRLIAGNVVEEPFERREAVGFRPCQRFYDANDYHRVALDLTDALAERCSTDSRSRASIRIALDELSENVVHHAESPVGGVAAAQGYPRKHEFEIGIVDLGIGIRQSLTKNPAYAEIPDDVTAIETAMQPRVTSTPERNAGIGLFVTRLLLRANGGVLAIRSGRGAIYTGASERTIVREVSFPGTMVALRARTDRPLNIGDVYRQLDEVDNRNDDD